MDGLAGAVALGLAGLIAVSALLSLVRGDRAVTRLGLLTGALVPPFVATLYWTQFELSLAGGALVGLVGAGVAGGYATGSTIGLRRVDRSIVAGRVSRLQAPYLLALAGAQTAGALESADWFVLALAATVMTATLSFVASAVVTLRRYRLVADQDDGNCPGCSRPVHSDWRFCMDCGTALSARTTARAGT